MHCFISSCPIPFHDILEVFDFLINLSPRYLLMYDGQYITICDFPVLQLRVLYVDGCYRITYRDLHCNFRQPLRSNG